MRTFVIRSCGLILVALFSLLAACGKDGKAVNVSTYQLPSELGDIDIDYIPYEYAEDGCWARAFFLSMELAVHDIPSAAIDVQTCGEEFEFWGPQGVRWKHHVTVVVWRKGTMQLIDPMLAGHFLTLEEWLTAIGATNDIKVAINPAAYPTSDGNQNCGDFKGEETNRVDSLDKMTPFTFDDVMANCADLRQYIQLSGKDSDRREAQLISHTRELVLQLAEMGQIEVYEESNEEWLKLQHEPYCPDPVAEP